MPDHFLILYELYIGTQSCNNSRTLFIYNIDANCIAGNGNLEEDHERRWGSLYAIYTVIIIYDTILRQKRNFKHEKMIN